jgi:hypothetical protein
VSLSITTCHRSSPALLYAGLHCHHSTKKADYVVEDLVLVDLVEDFVLRSRVDVLFDIASTQVLHRLRSRIEWSKDV